MIDINQNYFQLLNLPKGFDIDSDALRRNFQKLQQTYHPDRFVNASDREKRTALQITGLINKAYETLLDDQARARYLLTLDGVEFDEEKDTTRDLDFLQSQMELREQIDRLSDDEDSLDDLDQLARVAKAQKQELSERFRQALGEQDYPVAKEIVLKMQFYHRLQQQIRHKQEHIEEYS